MLGWQPFGIASSSDVLIAIVGSGSVTTESNTASLLILSASIPGNERTVYIPSERRYVRVSGER